MRGLTLRWTWRDLRARWVQVAVIALVVAVGTGMYAGMMSMSQWAEKSYDASYEITNLHDVRATLAPGSLAEAGSLTEIVRQLEGVERAEERLIVPIQFDASTPGETIVVRGVLIGAPIDAEIDTMSVLVGRGLTADDRQAVVLERNFGTYYDLPATGAVTLAGGNRVQYVGQAVAPEYFIVQPPDGGFFGQAEYGVLFTSLGTAQALSGFTNAVNDLLVTGTMPQSELADTVTAVLSEEVPELGATVTTGEAEPTRRLLYDDLEGDRQFFQVFAALIFAGAVVAAFTLTARMVEATRREFGIAMALGVPRPRIAIRPLLVGAQISLLGAAFGVGLGLVINSAMGAVLEEFLPLPVWETPFQVREFALAAGIGFFAPFLAAAVPVMRALRVQPVEAIRTGHLAARSQGFAPLLRRLPGDTFTKMPFRNLLRAPRRTLLTALGVGAAVTVLVGMVVMVDSFVATIDAGAAEMTAGSPDRILVGVDTFRPTDSAEIIAVEQANSVASAEPSLKIPATVAGPGSSLDVQIEVVDMESDLWHPTIVAGSVATDGIVLAEKGAADLGVDVGDTVTVRHPRREGVASFGLVDSELTVAAIHPHPFRFVAYLDDSQADVFGMAGLTNSLSIEPAAGHTIGDVQRELFDNGAVTSVLAADSVADIIRDFLEQFLGILQIAEAGAIALMFLIAFNSASVAFDERARDHATMMAFGVPRRRIMSFAVVESSAIGVLATILGALGGFGFLRWAVRTNIEETVPDIALDYVVTPSLLVGVIGLGVIVVALAPLLTYRKLRRLDISSTLRVME